MSDWLFLSRLLDEKHRADLAEAKLAAVRLLKATDQIRSSAVLDAINDPGLAAGYSRRRHDTTGDK